MTNKLFYGDNLDVLREHIASESVDLIYLDPPFNSNANYNILFKSKTGDGADAQIEAFEDTWHWNDHAEDAFDQVIRSGNTDAAELLRAMRTDVNLATHLLVDAFDDTFDVAVIISSDSDLKEPIRLVRDRFGKRIALLGPRATRISGALRPLADYIRQFGPNALAQAQFPGRMQDAVGAFHKPPRW